jgi:hypothetical protein
VPAPRGHALLAASVKPSTRYGEVLFCDAMVGACAQVRHRTRIDLSTRALQYLHRVTVDTDNLVRVVAIQVNQRKFEQPRGTTSAILPGIHAADVTQFLAKLRAR